MISHGLRPRGVHGKYIGMTLVGPAFHLEWFGPVHKFIISRSVHIRFMRMLGSTRVDGYYNNLPLIISAGLPEGGSRTLRRHTL